MENLKDRKRESTECARNNSANVNLKVQFRISLLGKFRLEKILPSWIQEVCGIEPILTVNMSDNAMYI